VSDHRPVFEVSPERRPVGQRLTPLAWALVGVAGLVVLLGIAGGVAVLSGRSPATVWQPTPTATTQPTATVPLPTTTPTEWWEGVMTPTPEPTPAFPAWWADHMTRDENGHWWAPEEVADMVRGDFNAFAEEALHEVFFASEIPDLETYEKHLAEWFSGPYLDYQRNIYVPNVRAGAMLFRTSDWQECLVQVQEWSPDGLECTVGRTCRDGTRYSYDFAIDEHTIEEVGQMGLILIRMRYDSFDGRWKMHEPLEFVPPSE